MTMTLTRSAEALAPVFISQEVRTLGVLNPVACIFRNVKVVEGTAEPLTPVIEELMNRLKETQDSHLNRREVQGFRKIFEKLGYEDQIPAGERVFHSFLEKGFKRFDNIVDAYNVSALEAVAGLGMHDAKLFLEQSEPLSVWRAENGLRIKPMFQKKTRPVQEGDMVYGLKSDNSTDLVAWLGKYDKDSDLWKVTEKTTDLLFVVLGNEDTSEEYNRKICERTFELIQKTCPEVKMELLTVEHEESH